MAKRQEQPTIPGTLTDDEKALEELLDKIIDRREQITRCRAALKDATEQAQATMRKLGKKSVTFRGFEFRRETAEKLKVAADKNGAIPASSDAPEEVWDGSQDADGNAPLAGTPKRSRKAAAV